MHKILTCVNPKDDNKLCRNVSEKLIFFIIILTESHLIFPLVNLQSLIHKFTVKRKVFANRVIFESVLKQKVTDCELEDK